MTTRYREPPSFLKEELSKIANYLMTPGKGILAMDQSVETMGMRLEELNIENTEDNRLKFRELVLLASDEIGEYLSGIIFSTEAFFHELTGGDNIVQCLKKKGIVTGIKLDTGLLPLIGSEGECTTAGLNDLDELCQYYKHFECHFAKWRCVYRVGDNLPSPLAISNNAEILARFASICQYHRLVPIIEPEILPEGSHSLERSQKIAETALAALVKSLNTHHVYKEGLILKVNFVTPGMQRKITYTPEEVALATVTALNRTIPPATGGIVFLAGGSCEDDATNYLDSVNQPIGRHPWPMSFSFGRGMLTSVLKTWAGEDEKVEEARLVLLARAKNNSLAAQGKYQDTLKRMMRKSKKEEERRKALQKYVHTKVVKTHRYQDETVESVE